MKRPRVDVQALRKTKWWEYVLRFVFGGAVTVGAGFIAHAYGPAIGGLFLAFPAILPAALTLVRVHDGRAKAADDARGAQLGAAGLIAFGLLVSTLERRSSGVLIPLAVALVTWFFVSTALWFMRFARRE
jgi:hypothetical protein